MDLNTIKKKAGRPPKVKSTEDIIENTTEDIIDKTEDIIETDTSNMTIIPDSSKTSNKTPNSLIRCIVTCHNPSKTELPGEFIRVSNNKYQIARYIPFNAPWHMERLIFDTLKEKTFQAFQNKVSSRLTTSETVIKPEYTIQVLPDLTEQELSAIKSKQNALDYEQEA